MNREFLETLITAIEAESTNLHSECHGPQHWRCVALLGIRLARQTEGAEVLVAFLFGLFHDALRQNDHIDPDHGVRAASLAHFLRLQGVLIVDENVFRALTFACTTHTEAPATDDPVVGVCYDADRLNLWRVNIQPKALYLSTHAGKEMARTDATRRMHGTPLQWTEVLEELFAETKGVAC